jgi:hypothetical protein
VRWRDPHRPRFWFCPVFGGVCSVLSSAPPPRKRDPEPGRRLDSRFRENERCIAPGLETQPSRR